MEQRSQGPRIRGPNDGKAVDFGSFGVRFMVWSEESRGGFSLVEHPIPRGRSPLRFTVTQTRMSTATSSRDAWERTARR